MDRGYEGLSTRPGSSGTASQAGDSQGQEGQEGQGQSVILSPLPLQAVSCAVQVKS